jgi:hypothetical protein
MATTQVVKGLIMSESRLLNWNRRWVLSARNFTNSGGVRHFDQAWLRKAADIVEGRRGNVN